MRGRLGTIGIVLILLLTLVWSAPRGTANQDAANDQTAGIDALGIAVVDVSRIFKEHRRFNERLKTLREENDEFRKKVALRQVEIEATQRKLQRLQRGSPEFEQTELLLARLQTELKQFSQRQQQQLLGQETGLYADTYDEVTTAVGRYAQQRNIRLVLRSNDVPADPNNRQSVLGAVNRQVVYQQGLDITDVIVQQLNAKNQ
jgi:Skp family chaperone for outer membrane proteins